MRIIFFLLFTFASAAFAAQNTEVSCEMKREEWDKMSFDFKFMGPKRALTTFTFKHGELSGNQNVPVSAIHQSSEARYVGVNFQGDEKLVFILLTPIFTVENLGIPFDIEVVSSIYGPTYLKCRATK